VLPSGHGAFVALLLGAGGRHPAQPGDGGGRPWVEACGRGPGLGAQFVGAGRGRGHANRGVGHRAAGGVECDAGPLGADDGPLEGDVGAVRERLPVEDVAGRGGGPEVEAEHRQPVAR
jgi:hypothetical protein